MISADLSRKAVLVTGGASGIGLATAEAFARNGAAVALNHLPEDPRGPRASFGRWFSATLAPQRAKASAEASPIPEAAPVTSTAFPVRSALIMG